VKRQEINLGSYYWIRYGTVSVYLAEAIATNDPQEAVMKIADGHMKGKVTATIYEDIIGDARPQDVAKVVLKPAKTLSWWFW